MWKKLTRKQKILRALLFLWAVALVSVGVIYYKNSNSCWNCQASSKHPDFFSSLTVQQQDSLRNRRAIILIPDKSDPIYVDEEIAYNNPQITAFTYEQPESLSEDEVKQFIVNVLHRRFVDNMPEQFRSLYSERKLAVLQSKDGDFFIVALADYIKDF